QKRTAALCNEQCYGQSLCPPSIEEDCRIVTRGLVPFCTNNCYTDCRNRYQARDARGRPVYAYGNPDELNHNLVEINRIPGARVVQRNTYATDPFSADFDRVVDQELGSDVLDTTINRHIGFYYYDLLRDARLVERYRAEFGFNAALQYLTSAFWTVANRVF